MKIISLETLRSKRNSNALFEQIHTDEGASSAGETFYGARSTEPYSTSLNFLMHHRTQKFKKSSRCNLIFARFVFLVATVLGMPFSSVAQVKTLYTGSDTVYPVAEAALHLFVRGHAGYKPQIKAPGTSPGLKELCLGNAVMSGSSRPMKAEESKLCSTAGIQITEIPVAIDAVAMVVSTKNTWLKDLTLEELSKAFDSASAGKVISWKQIRSSFPDLPLKTAGVGIKHATFGFFSESLNLKGFIRSDYKDFKNHTETSKYAAGDAAVLAFVPIGEVKVMEGQIRPVSVDFGAGATAPGAEEVAAGKYDKLSRTIYLYINTAALAKSSLDDIAFTNMLVKDMDKFVRFVNLVPLRGLQYQENTKRFAAAGR